MIAVFVVICAVLGFFFAVHCTLLAQLVLFAVGCAFMNSDTVRVMEVDGLVSSSRSRAG